MIDFPLNPTVGQTFQVGGCIYKCVAINPAVWSATMATGGIPDAPVDDRTYGRRNGAWEILTKATIGLSQVDNTSDANKPVSTAQAAADALRVLKAGDTMTGALTIAPLSPASPALVLNRNGTDKWMGIISKSDGDQRWGIGLGNQLPAADLVIDRYNDAGTWVDIPFKIQRADGQIIAYTKLRANAGVYTPSVISDSDRLLLQTNQTVDAVNVANNVWSEIRASGFTAQTGHFFFNSYGSINWPNNVQIYQDTGGGNIVFRTYDGTLHYPNFGSNGYLNAPGANTGPINSSGRIQSWAAEVAAFYASSQSGGFYTEGSASNTFYAVRGGCDVDASQGFRTHNYYADGSNWYTRIMTTSPNWGPAEIQGYHYSGNWAGYRILGGGGAIEFRVSGSAIYCTGGYLGSDIRHKANRVPIANALAKLDGIQAWTYTLTNVSEDFHQQEIRHAGLIAQEVFGRVREAVDAGVDYRDVTDVSQLPVDSPLMSLEYAGITAINSQAISELLQYARSLEARIAALEGAP